MEYMSYIENNLRKDIFAYLKKKYKTKPEYLKKKQEMCPPKEWLIPFNSKYYDIIHAFDDTDTIDWKQGKCIKKNDKVFMYVGIPVSAIPYKCKVIETDIPYEYHTDELTIKKLMKIKLQKRYKPEQFIFERLKTEYDIFAVRSLRGVPNSLSIALKGMI